VRNVCEMQVKALAYEWESVRGEGDNMTVGKAVKGGVNKEVTMGEK